MASVRQPSSPAFQLACRPREIRNRIYQEIVTAQKPIEAYRSFDQIDFGKAWIRNGNGAPCAFCDAIAGSSLAPEVYEELFRTNRILIDMAVLPFFINSSAARVGRNIFWFNRLPWLRSLIIMDYSIRGWTEDVDESLGLISQCSQLQSMKYNIVGDQLTNSRISDVDERIEDASAVLTTIRKQIGEGLSVQPIKQWHRSRFRRDKRTLYFKEDISWMWEPPSEETKQSVANGFGSHRDCIRVLMLTGCKSRGNGVGKWATHWLLDQSPATQQAWGPD